MSLPARLEKLEFIVDELQLTALGYSSPRMAQVEGGEEGTGSVKT